MSNRLLAIKFYTFVWSCIVSTEGKTWSVRSAGELIEGFDQETVIKNFSTAFKITEDKAIPFLKKGKLIRKGLNEVEATNYKTQLEKFGLAISVEDTAEAENSAAAQSVKPKSNTGIPGLVPTGLENTANADNSAGIGSSHPAQSTQATSQAFSCPKCMLAQEKSDQCKGCGIIFEKFAQHNRTDHDSRDSTRPSSRDRVVSIEEENDVPIVAIAAAVVAAVVFAFIWKFVAVQFNKEYGLIALAVGGAIGGAAVAFGGRGTVMGGICACLVVGSIFLGKYMFVSSYMEESIAYMEELSDGDWIDVVYDEIASEREAYAAIPKDSNSIKKFMIDYQYTDASEIVFVHPDDFHYFKNEIEPWLLMEDEQDGSDYDTETPPDFAAAMEEITPWSLVRDSLGLFDLLFLFFGISTAFRLAQAGLQED